MLARCHSACVRGVDGEATEVEVDHRSANPRFDVVGLADAAGREARDRVRAAIHNSGYLFPPGALVVNLAPAGTPKAGPGHDLPMALGILSVDCVLPRGALRGLLAFGELALDGRLRPVRGAFLLASTARRRGLDRLLVPPGNAQEAALAAGDLPVFAPATLADAVRFLAGRARLTPVVPDRSTAPAPHSRDFADVKGQESVKKAVLVAAAGGHNLLFVGPPGSGKTLMAERMPDILPPLETEEALEVARLRSAAGLPVRRLPRVRPFRAPSCGASAPGVLGGGNPPTPGEASLAHRGILFLDELPHFRGDLLEGLRQPLESGDITVSRSGVHSTFPARFQLVAAMNPCPCGHSGTPRCPCTPIAKERYLRRLSGPLLDRIDLRVHVPAVKYAELRATTGPCRSTDDLRADVARARAAQLARFADPRRLNAHIRAGELERWCRLDRDASALLEQHSATGRLSARGIARVRRVARTLSDLEPAADPSDPTDPAAPLTRSHVLTALNWRVEPAAVGVEPRA